MTGVEPHRDPIDPMVGRTAPEWDAVIAGLPTVADPWPPSGPLVLVAPHPDDELLAAGATLAAAFLAMPAFAEDLSVGHTKGSKDAPLTLIEYGSLTCGGCKYFHDKILPRPPAGPRKS